MIYRRKDLFYRKIIQLRKRVFDLKRELNLEKNSDVQKIFKEESREGIFCRGRKIDYRLGGGSLGSPWMKFDFN